MLFGLNFATGIDSWFLPSLIVLLLIDFVLIYRFFSLVRLCELVTLAIFSVYHITKYYIYIQIDHDFDFYMLWSSVFYIFTFIALNSHGFIYALTIHCFVILLWVTHLTHHIHIDPIIIQLLISNSGLIVFLYFFQKLYFSYFESLTLRKFAFEDSLTNIANRRMLDLWLKTEIIKGNEKNIAFSLIFFDIDNFKKINDSFGHEIGDNVLKEISALIQTKIRDSDYFGRWGGEEFLIIVKDQDEAQSVQFAERLRALIENHCFVSLGKVTASFGITSSTENDSAETIIKRVDSALYLAKEKGRNRVEVCRT
jgi:diguanylate cyclase (GGDEF)-like protein